MTRIKDDVDFLMQAIVSNPDDMIPRLQLADELEARAAMVDCPACKDGVVLGSWDEKYRRCPKCDGKKVVSNGLAERAEFIRLQIDRMDTKRNHTCSRGKRPDPADCKGCSDHLRILSRENELLRGWWDAWFGIREGTRYKRPNFPFLCCNFQCRLPNSPGNALVVYERGFVYSLELTYGQWINGGPASLLNDNPIRFVTLTTSPGIVRDEELGRAKLYGMPFVDYGNLGFHYPGMDRMALTIELLKYYWHGPCKNPVKFTVGSSSINEWNRWLPETMERGS